MESASSVDLGGAATARSRQGGPTGGSPSRARPAQAHQGQADRQAERHCRTSHLSGPTRERGGERAGWHSSRLPLVPAAILPGNRHCLHCRNCPATDGYALGARWFSCARLLPACAPGIREQSPDQSGDEEQEDLLSWYGLVVWQPVLFHRRLPLSNAGLAGPTPHLAGRRTQIVLPDLLERACGGPPRTRDQGLQESGKALRDEAGSLFPKAPWTGPQTRRGGDKKR